MTDREFYSKNRVLFVSNGDDDDFSPFNISFKTYEGLVDGNFMLVQSNGGSVFGYGCFMEAIGHALKYGYDYVIYVDADCFIASDKNLRTLFESFIEDGSVFGGAGDGGLFCHRNANKYSINPFISFFNIAKIRENYVKDGSLVLNDSEKFDDSLCTELTKTRIDSPIMAYEKFRLDNNYIVPYANMISSDSNPFEWLYGKNQRVWTCSDTKNAEPYYTLFLGMYNGSADMSFFYGRDYVCELDADGITSAVYADGNISDDSNIVCLHTWFARLCNSGYANTELGKLHRNRIFGIGNFILNNKNS